ncbi:MAG: hypothetical protein AAGG44_21220 [Planctomycetota bacterium]
MDISANLGGKSATKLQSYIAGRRTSAYVGVVQAGLGTGLLVQSGGLD